MKGEYMNNKYEWIKEPVGKIVDCIFGILIEEGQNNASKYGFKLGDTIKFSPSEVADIINNHSENFYAAGLIGAICTSNTQLPKTVECIKKIENAFQHLFYIEDPKKISEEERFLIDNPMLTLAGVLYSEAPEWAEDLAKFLCVIGHIDTIEAKVEIKEGKI